MASPLTFCYVKVYYHLGAFDESVTYALGAESLFDVNTTSEYVETIVGKLHEFTSKLHLHSYFHDD